MAGSETIPNLDPAHAFHFFHPALYLTTQNRRADPVEHILAEELSQSLMNSVQELLRRYDRQGTPLEGRDRLYLSIGSQYLTSVYDG